jgi:hypothetical protein
MKHARLLLLALCMTAGVASINASAEVDGKVQRCQAKLHTCFKTGDLTQIFTFTPEVASDCASFCSLADGNTNACSQDECQDRCEVAFGLTPPPCE